MEPIINNDKTCSLCNNDLQLSNINPEFYECVLCKTQTRIINDESFKSDFYNTEYLKDIPAEIRVLTTNKTHYKTLFNLFLKSKEYCNVIEDIKNNNIDTCYCYGGGFPQIEVSLPVSHITILDLIAPIYKKNLNIFKDLYDTTNKKIQYKVHDLLNGVIPTSTKTLVSFVHILEHFPLRDIDLILKSVVNNLPDGSYGIIYQPNIAAVKGIKWVHYISQHMTFIPILTFVDYINSFENLTVKFNMAYSDDLFIIFKVNKLN